MKSYECQQGRAPRKGEKEGLTSVSKGQCPESQVGGGVGDAAQTKLNGVDSLVDEHLSKLKLKQSTWALQKKRKGEDCSEEQYCYATHTQIYAFLTWFLSAAHHLHGFDV